METSTSTSLSKENARSRERVPKVNARHKLLQHKFVSFMRLSVKTAAFMLLLSLLLGILKTTRMAPSRRREPIRRLESYFDLLEVQIPRLEGLVEGTAGISGIAFRFLQGEMATIDLSQAASAAGFGDSMLIASSLRQYAAETKASRRALTRFSVTVMGAIDIIASLNSVAIADIKSILRNSPRSFYSRSPSETLARSYFSCLISLSTQLRRISNETNAASQSIDTMQQRVSTLRELLDSRALTLGESAEVLSDLWETLRPRSIYASRSPHQKWFMDLDISLSVAAQRLNEASQAVRGMSENMAGFFQASPELQTGTDDSSLMLQMIQIEAMLKGLEEKRDATKKRSEEITDWVLSNFDEG